MKVPGTDRRHAGAVKRLLADQIDAGRITALAATIHIEHADPLAFWDECLDRVFPEWRSVPTTAYRQNVSDPLLLVAVRERLCKALGIDSETIPEPKPAPGPQTPQKPLWRLSLEEPMPLYAGGPPTEMHVRKAPLSAQHFTDPVRCGKCGEWMEKRTRSTHAHNRHNRGYAEIAWYSPKGF